MKRNKVGFKSLADDSRNLVYAFICVNRYADDVPTELQKQLLNRALTCVEFKLHVMDFPFTYVRLGFFLRSKGLYKKPLLRP